MPSWIERERIKIQEAHHRMGTAIHRIIQDKQPAQAYRHLGEPLPRHFKLPLEPYPLPQLKPVQMSIPWHPLTPPKKEARPGSVPPPPIKPKAGPRKRLGEGLTL